MNELNLHWLLLSYIVWVWKCLQQIDFRVSSWIGKWCWWRERERKRSFSSFFFSLSLSSLFFVALFLCIVSERARAREREYNRTSVCLFGQVFGRLPQKKKREEKRRRRRRRQWWRRRRRRRNISLVNLPDVCRSKTPARFHS